MISEQPPKILSNRQLDERTVLVTYSLPGLRNATVRVPMDRWQAGGHATIGARLAQIAAELDLQKAIHDASIP